MNVQDFVERIKRGDRRILAKAISFAENGHPIAKEILRQIYDKTGKAQVVGITGFPGTGKSTLVSKLVEEFRKRGKSVGVVAVDPSSPFTGGALLGDRLRLNGADVDKNLWTDERVFFRSMGSRGRLGGIAKKTGDVVKLLDAAGYDMILVETVGAGQGEIGILEVADTAIVVLMPEMGDDIQVNKAGILEIGDIFVINKSDLEGAENLERWLSFTLSLDSSDSAEKGSANAERWRKRVIKTVATRGEGIKELADAITEHFEFLKRSGTLEIKRAERTKMMALEIAMEEIRAEITKRCSNLLLDSKDPYTIAERILKDIIKI
ncbi:MAG: methylmalonyl Co-A mutase-associated GTPase MeaB [Archaeoglobi archaeon]|nr:MAG: methylmalonyl Co-A mutase-associated GTPase MeaB [Archaeoglobi archaeon]